MANERTPAWKISTFGFTSGVSASDVSRWPPPVVLRMPTRLPATPRLALRITVVGPPTTAPWTPASVVIAASSPSPCSPLSPACQRHTWSSVASPRGLAWNVTPASDTSTIDRTSRSIGVTDSPPINSRRVPRSTPVVTRRPSGRNAGTPGTRSIHSSLVLARDDGGRAGGRVDAQHHRAALIA